MLVKLTEEWQRRLVHRLREQAERWLAAKGHDQYQASEKQKLARQAIDDHFERGEFVGWLVDGQVKAVLALTHHDPDFWTPEEMMEPASYISRFLVAEHGQGYGEALLEAVVAREAANGQKAIRLDCWLTNRGLHEYYLRHGFRHVRSEIVPGRMSGALFQRDI